MIYITGDTHGEIDIDKLDTKNWSEGKFLSKSDYLIILGDFGFLWEEVPDQDEINWIKWFEKQKWTTLFIDGNHENHNRLEKLELVPMFGSHVGKVSNSVFHLKRGHIYTVENKTLFCFGGAFSNDFDFRVNQENWWPQEIPSEREFQYGLSNLDKCAYEVDYLLFHTIPTSIQDQLQSKKFNAVDPTCKMLEKYYKKTTFTKGFSGHFHVDKDFTKWSMVFNRILSL